MGNEWQLHQRIKRKTSYFINIKLENIKRSIYELIVISENLRLVSIIVRIGTRDWQIKNYSNIDVLATTILQRIF